MICYGYHCKDRCGQSPGEQNGEKLLVFQCISLSYHDMYRQPARGKYYCHECKAVNPCFHTIPGEKALADDDAQKDEEERPDDERELRVEILHRFRNLADVPYPEHGTDLLSVRKDHTEYEHAYRARPAGKLVEGEQKENDSYRKHETVLEILQPFQHVYPYQS